MAVPPHERREHDDELASVVASNVRALMAVRHVSQTQLAAHLGYSQSGVSNRLRGQIPFNVTDLERISRLFRVSPIELVTAGFWTRAGRPRAA